MKQFLTRLTGLCAICALAGCAGLTSLSNATEPTDLYLLSPKSTFDPSLPRVRQQIVVSEPTATAVVSNDRIAVQPNPLEVRFLPGARWVDRAPLIIQSLLIESYENSGKVDAVGRSAIGLRADYLIVTDVREFQAQLPPNSAPDAPLEAHVRLNIKIVDAFTDKIIASRSFTEVFAAASDAPPDIVLAFDEALGDALRDAVEWSIRRMHSDSLQRDGNTRL